MYGTWRIKTVDQLANKINENMGTIDSTNYFSSDSAVKEAFLNSVDTAARSIANLTTNNYSDSEISFAISINDELEGGE